VRPRHHLVRLLTFLAIAALVAACGGDTRAGGATTISLLVFGDPEELHAYRVLRDEFSSVRPNITVKLVETSDRDDLLARLSTSFAGGSPPDLFLLNYRFYGQFAARSLLEPVEHRLRESQSLDEADFYEQALDAFRFEGTLTCLPQNVSSLVVYYNRDAFQAARLREPGSDWTWSEMLGAASALTADLDGDGTTDQFGLAVDPTLIRIAPFVWSNGGQLVDDDERPTRLTLDSRAAREALDSFFALRRVHRVVPGETEAAAEDAESRFMNGRVAMILSSRRSTTSFRTIDAFEWDVAPLPRHRRRAEILHADAYCMTKASAAKDSAWQFIEFALGSSGQRIIARTGRTVPSLVEVAQSREFLDPDSPPARARVFLDAIPHVRRVPTISTWPEIEDAAEQILEAGFYYGVPTEDVVGRLDAVTREMFARGRR
jgi:multiple sugar transport system substrate-binding protein